MLSVEKRYDEAKLQEVPPTLPGAAGKATLYDRQTDDFVVVCYCLSYFSRLLSLRLSMMAVFLLSGERIFWHQGEFWRRLSSFARCRPLWDI